MKVGDLVKFTTRGVVQFGLITARLDSWTWMIVTQKDGTTITAREGWLEVINESR